MSAVVLLVETDEGDVMAVRFPTRDAAEAWEDNHDVTIMGLVHMVTAREALTMAGAA